ncbi:MAG: hypothetical protein FWG40_10675 [Peptococcaceae bacterium]|nr:hypothetical protein [Peptococcaceae bacterium]
MKAERGMFIATDKNLTVIFTLEQKNYDEAQFLPEETERTKRGSLTPQPHVILHAGQRKISKYLGSVSGGGSTEFSTLVYDLKPHEIGHDQPYRLEHADYNLSLEFQLENLEAYNTLEEIGATGYNNNISITAVPIFITDDKLRVDLYSINKSAYEITSFQTDTTPYQNRDLHLDTSSGVKFYSTPSGFAPPNRTFFFDVDPMDQDSTNLSRIPNANPCWRFYQEYSILI